MEIPMWANTYIRKENLEGILQSIRNAEAKTSGEIIPMIVKQSSATGHVPLVVACLTMIVILILTILNPNHTTSDYYYLWYILDMAVIGAATYILPRCNFVKRLFTRPSDQAYQVGLRAEVEFYEAGLQKTVGATGILLFVSLLERRAVVLADKAIADKLPPTTWEEICQILIVGSKNREMEKAFIQAIDKCGGILAQHFPRQTDDQNEVTDHLIIKD